MKEMKIMNLTVFSLMVVFSVVSSTSMLIENDLTSLKTDLFNFYQRISM